jgi:hypothetical protein
VLNELIGRYNESEDRKMHPLLDNSDESMLGKEKEGKEKESQG